MPPDPSHPIRTVIYCPTRAKDIATLLKQRGFRVFEANSLDEASKLVQRERCHVALVDHNSIKEALSPKSEDVFSDLSETLHLACCFVLCSRSRVATREVEAAINAGIRLVPAGPKHLKTLPDKIQRTINQHRAAKLSLKWEVLEETARPAVLSDEEDLHWVLSHLLPRASELRVDVVKSRGRSAVLEGRINGLAIPALVKIGSAAKIQQEIDNYERFIYRQLGTTYHALVDQRYCRWNLGGILYIFLGSNGGMESFSDFYQRAEAGQIREVLTHLYERTLRGLYRRKEWLRDSIYEAYDHYLNLTERLMDFPPSSSGFGLPDPINWVMSNKQRSHLRKEHVLVYEAISHGDLWGENIFIEGTRCWVVDYERTGWGHILRDFVELEVDILTRLSLSSPDKTRTFYELAVALAKPSTVLSLLPYWTALVKNDHEAFKAFDTIERLRYLADRVTRCLDIREYYWGLLLDALFAATLAPAGSLERERALMLASVLCGRLENWGEEEWPPLAWPSVEWEETSPKDPITVRSESSLQELKDQKSKGDITMAIPVEHQLALGILIEATKFLFGELGRRLDFWRKQKGDQQPQTIEPIQKSGATVVKVDDLERAIDTQMLYQNQESIETTLRILTKLTTQLNDHREQLKTDPLLDPRTRTYLKNRIPELEKDIDDEGQRLQKLLDNIYGE